jgi:hypothetical protein
VFDNAASDPSRAGIVRPSSLVYPRRAGSRRPAPDGIEASALAGARMLGLAAQQGCAARLRSQLQSD